jgi:hypothetical protein
MVQCMSRVLHESVSKARIHGQHCPHSSRINPPCPAQIRSHHTRGLPTVYPQRCGCGIQVFSDMFYTDSRYAKVSGLPQDELNQLHFLLFNKFRLIIYPATHLPHPGILPSHVPCAHSVLTRMYLLHMQARSSSALHLTALRLAGGKLANPHRLRCVAQVVLVLQLPIHLCQPLQRPVMRWARWAHTVVTVQPVQKLAHSASRTLLDSACSRVTSMSEAEIEST